MRFVELQTEAFEATVPVVHDIGAFALASIIDEPDSRVAFVATCVEFRKALAQDKRDEYDQLQVDDLVPLLTTWIKESRALVEGVAR